MIRSRQSARDAAGRDRGSATLELAILAPTLLLLLGLVVLAGRVQVAASGVEHAASTAARDASLARTVESARAAATEAATRELDAQGLRCAPSSIDLDMAGFAATVGASATVTATVSCTITFADLAIPGLPGSRTLTGAATSPLDQYRTR